MVLRPFFFAPTACASHLFGCLTHNQLAVVDPHAELVDEYVEEARRLGAPIGAVFETHVQADHVSGLPALVEAGATAYLPAGATVDFEHVALGDGGSANDPYKVAQKLDTLLAKILRIDVNGKDEGKKYAVPKDNPFVGRNDALPEIWAYGLRNVWRMAFDRKTGQLWAGEVGQNLYEEINLIVKGGNYGWSLRESLHPFSVNGIGPRKDMIEPIWEYHHDIGKSITGGTVYRGTKLPEIEGHYLYADYVSNKLWALKYDEKAGRVTANHSIPDPAKPVLSFGEDENGEVYFLTVAANGKGIYRFTK